MKTLLLASILLSGCVTASLTLKPIPPTDRSVESRTKKTYSSLMVLMTDPRQEAEQAALERVLLGAGIRVISAGVTGRVVQDDESRLRVETGKDLTGLERALVLAKRSNAEGLLQVMDVGWKDNTGRPFVLKGERFEEVPAGSMVDGTKLLRVQEGVFKLQARVIDVDSGEIVVSIDLAQTTTRALPEPRTMTMTVGGTEPMPDISTDDAQRRQLVVDQVMNVLIARLNSAPKTPVSPEAAQ